MINPNKTETTMHVRSESLFSVIYPSIFDSELEKIAQAKHTGKKRLILV